MYIDSIRNGIVIDHIAAGKGTRLYRLLRLDELDCAVALITNAVSAKMGRKDIIKIDGNFDLDMDILGFVDPHATVNVIRDGELFEKRSIALPRRLTNILFCRNPRCITSTEQELPQVFTLDDSGEGVYRCLYCEAASGRTEE